ncbi:S9 family peptidase [Plantactinospora sp. CA-290183]|uniref:S9 family peptidase n=1 Tax=Plantactinospora sp. CA-290183 TaxID=3240006 RepID=UPI003D90881C
MAPLDGVRTIWVRPVDGGEPRPLTGTTNAGIFAFTWAHDGRHVLYVQDRDGDENTHLYAADTGTGETRDLTPFHGVQARMVGAQASAPHHVLVGLNRRDRRLHDVHRVDLRSGELTPVAENPGFAGWMADRQLRVRGALRWSPDGGLSIMARDGSAPWRPVHTVDSEDSTTTRAIGFTGDGSGLVILSSADANTARVLRVDVATGATKTLYQDPEYDVSGVDLNPLTGEADLVVVDRDRTRLHGLTPDTARTVDHLQRLFDGDVLLVGRDAADRGWLVLDYGPERVATYYHYDRTTGRAQPLFDHRPVLADYTLAPVEPFSFQARDGRTIHGYLTFPPGLDRRALPAVLAVHGGPWDRDRWGSGECQWLANRGYLSVQVNFRGSIGYGKDFVNAGDREWGGRMQDDLTDAVHWLVAQGYADPARVAIHGGSYGGYAALAGAAFTPDLYACAVAVCAPSDLRTFVRSTISSAQLLAPRIRRRIGDPDLDDAFLWSRSPLSRVDDIRIPVLVAHGANDPRVRRAEADQLVAALAANGVPHRYLLFDDEGHGFAKLPNRMAFYASTEQFLAEHLGGRCEPAQP